MLVAELDHRVKNVLATVSAVAAHTMDASSSMDQFVAALDGRIRSMASTHELLSDRRWKGMPLAELLRRELAPYATSNNMDVEGPEVLLSADAGQTIAMVLHELVTNAAKHGALSTRDGRISVRWYWPLNGKVPDRMVIEWLEVGGPAVQVPDRSGHGMEVIRDLLPYELKGNVDLEFASEGVRCRFDIPAFRLSNDDRLGNKFNEVQRSRSVIAHQDKCAGSFNATTSSFDTWRLSHGRVSDHSDGRRLLGLASSVGHSVQGRGSARCSRRLHPPRPSDSFFARVWRVLPWNPRCRQCRYQGSGSRRSRRTWTRPIPAVANENESLMSFMSSFCGT